ncbi:hypothetical protein [Nodularia sp. UHCC 0506]|uniref:hypothetical protein n=1 Tax=Nodularia sp. UHCC 0506 TaxID=3110243 RepID=UPI002B21DD38|nr:hypothetical protein [Nodularia sp. UHCC 0506]MEA5515676.1 hypothetical protein [Nodularia sp. UHCC 0506]
MQLDTRLEKANLTFKAMKAIEVMATVDEQGQLSLDLPLSVDKHSRIGVIILRTRISNTYSTVESQDLCS